MRSLNGLKCAVLGIMLLLAACTQQPVSYTQVPVSQPVAIQPGVSFGYVGNAYMAHVTDQSGVSYLMDYMLFTQLMNQGGYNTVSQYYYQHPSGGYIHPWNAGHWQASYTSDATKYGTMYRNSYHDAYVHHTVYHTTVVHNTTVVNHAAPTATTTASTVVTPAKPAATPITVAKVTPQPVSVSKQPVTVARVSTPMHSSPAPRMSAYKSSSSRRSSRH